MLLSLSVHILDLYQSHHVFVLTKQRLICSIFSLLIYIIWFLIQLRATVTWPELSNRMHLEVLHIGCTPLYMKPPLWWLWSPYTEASANRNRVFLALCTRCLLGAHRRPPYCTNAKQNWLSQKWANEKKVFCTLGVGTYILTNRNGRSDKLQASFPFNMS